MNIYILTWNEYIIGVFSTNEKAKKAIEYYEEIEKFDDPRYDSDFEIREFKLDNYSESLLNEIREDGWFEKINSSQTLKDKIFSISILLLIISTVLFAIFGFITFSKIIF